MIGSTFFLFHNQFPTFLNKMLFYFNFLFVYFAWLCFALLFPAKLSTMPFFETESVFKLEFLAISVLVPHLGSATQRTESDMARLAAQNVINVLEGNSMVAPAFTLS